MGMASELGKASTQCEGGRITKVIVGEIESLEGEQRDALIRLEVSQIHRERACE